MSAIIKRIFALLVLACALQAAKPGSPTINGSSISTGIIAAWIMTEGSGTTFADIGGSAMTAVLGPSATTLPSWVNNDATFQPGLQYANTSPITYAQATNNLNVLLSSFSFMLVEKSTVGASYAEFFTSNQSTPEIEFRLEAGSTDVNFLVHGFNNMTSGKNFADGATHVVIGTYKNTAGTGQTDIYQDGTNVYTHSTTSSDPDLRSTATFTWGFGDRAGGAGGAGNLTGTEYMLVFWNRQLTSSEVTTLQGAPFTFITGGGGGSNSLSAAGGNIAFFRQKVEKELGIEHEAQ